MPDHTLRIPSPHPIGRGVNSPRLFTQDGDLLVVFPEMAMDEAPKLPRAAIAGAAGGLNKVAHDDDDNVTVAESAGQAAFMRLSQFLDDLLSPDDLAQALQLVQQLLNSGDDANGNGDGDRPLIAGDRRPTQSYAARFPNSGRLWRKTYG